MTLQEKLTFHSGLTIGTHCVNLVRGRHSMLAVVLIGRVGSLPRLLLKSDANRPVISWLKVRGDDLEQGELIGAGYVHAERINALFDNQPIWEIKL